MYTYGRWRVRGDACQTFNGSGFRRRESEEVIPYVPNTIAESILTSLILSSKILVMAALCFPLAPFFPFTILLMAALSIPQRSANSIVDPEICTAEEGYYR